MPVAIKPASPSPIGDGGRPTGARRRSGSAAGAIRRGERRRRVVVVVVDRSVVVDVRARRRGRQPWIGGPGRHVVGGGLYRVAATVSGGGAGAGILEITTSPGWIMRRSL